MVIYLSLFLFFATHGIIQGQRDQEPFGYELDAINGACTPLQKECSLDASKNPSRIGSKYSTCARDVFKFKLPMAKRNHYSTTEELQNITTKMETISQDEFKTEEIVKSLETCDWTSLYEIKDTVKAFNEFKTITLKCIETVRLVKRTKDNINNICKTDKNKAPNLALICSNSSPTQALNNVNDYFAKVGENLALRILTEIGKSEENLANNIETKSNTPSFILEPTSEKEILDVINTSKDRSKISKDSCSHNYLSKLVIRKAKHVLALPIAYLCNLSFSSGIVPDSLKQFNTFPKFKSGDPKNPSHYRPISIMTFLGKIMEKVVHRRLISYLETNNLLIDNQYAFRQGRSKENAIDALVDRVTTQLDSGKKCIGIFLDLTKAFDTISRKILLKKMESLGIRDKPLDWFKSYFENQKQSLCIGNLHSDFAPVTFGIPQGSSLGPTLFLIYFNDFLKLNLPQAKPFAYADDTTVVIHGDTWQMAIDAAEKNLEMINEWLKNNLMSFNIIKTKFLAFRFSEMSAPKIPINIKIRNCSQNKTVECKEFVLKQVRSTKFLGVFLDDRLSWKEHIKYLNIKNKKLTHTINIMKKKFRENHEISSKIGHKRSKEE